MIVTLDGTEQKDNAVLLADDRVEHQVQVLIQTKQDVNNLLAPLNSLESELILP